MADSIIRLREQAINPITQLDDLIKKSADDRQDLLDEIKEIETEMKSISQDIENVNTINYYREVYKYHKKNPDDKQFAEEYYSELSVYKIAAKEILENYKKLPNTKEILTKLDKLQEKRNTLMQEYSLNKEQFFDLVQYRKNYENYYGKEVERT
ncbi:relaxase [Criibacterium bergeronii]|uniref:relaxase n=1 Tax=Criibacterium bergeronii TaxID=1871336 RepID=UPI000827D1E5|nr:relaxase [Criibacterium bergeronii]